MQTLCQAFQCNFNNIQREQEKKTAIYYKDIPYYCSAPIQWQYISNKCKSHLISGFPFIVTNDETIDRMKQMSRQRKQQTKEHKIVDFISLPRLILLLREHTVYTKQTIYKRVFVLLIVVRVYCVWGFWCSSLRIALVALCGCRLPTWKKYASISYSKDDRKESDFYTYNTFHIVFGHQFNALIRMFNVRIKLNETKWKSCDGDKIESHKTICHNLAVNFMKFYVRLRQYMLLT